MKNTNHATEKILQPGEFFFGDRRFRIRTLLGSCISVVMWHPKLLIGGMCHYMLSSRGGKRVSQLDGRYGDEAVMMFFREAIRHGTDPNGYVVKIFGGGNMFPDGKTHIPCVDRPCVEVIDACRNVSCKNIVKGTSLLEELGFSITSQDMGGVRSRNIMFDVWSGDVWVRKNSS